MLRHADREGDRGLGRGPRLTCGRDIQLQPRQRCVLAADCLKLACNAAPVGIIVEIGVSGGQVAACRCVVILHGSMSAGHATHCNDQAMTFKAKGMHWQTPVQLTGLLFVSLQCGSNVCDSLLHCKLYCSYCSSISCPLDAHAVCRSFMHLPFLPMSEQPSTRAKLWN